MNEQWQELKETIIELRDGNGTGTQQEVCKFLVNYMDILEKQMQQPSGDLISRKAILEEFENDQYHLEFCKEHHIDRSISMEMVRIRLHDLPSVNPQPCEDTISRQTVLDIVDSYSESQSNVEDVTQDIISDIIALPPVNPQPKTGHWMIDEDSTDRFFATYECSCCKRAIIVPHDLIEAVYKDYPFCHCGAKMVEPQERNEKE